MKIAVISDLHLGFRQYGSFEREQDFYKQFYKVCDEINKCEPDMVIIAGDLFDKPNPSPAAINAYRRGIEILDSDLICTIKGNHTMILRDDHYSIDEYFGRDDIYGYYYLDDSSMTVKDYAFDSPYESDFKKYKDITVQVDGITYRGKSDIDDFLRVQRTIAFENYDRTMFRILVVHQSFKEFCGFIGEELSIENLELTTYDVVICGHIHSRVDKRLPNGTWFIQPGSIERMNTTEALDEKENGKGFYLIDSEKDSVDFHKVECNRKFLLGDININSMKKLEDHLIEVQKIVSKLKVSPVISYKYFCTIGNIGEIREIISRSKENVLLDNSNVYDESEKEVSIEISDTELPTVLEALKMKGEKENFKEKEIGFMIDLLDDLNKDKESPKSTVDTYFKKNYKKEEKFEEFYDSELEELERYFENLEV